MSQGVSVRPGNLLTPATSRPPTSRRPVVASATGTIAARVAPGLTLEVLEGPLDGARWVGTGPRVTIGRAATNTFSLPLDRSVSSRHAVLTWDPSVGSWILEDLRSTNGTWLAGGRISSPQAIASGSEFILGYAVVKLMATAAGETFNPGPNELQQEAKRLVSRLSAAAAQGFGAAVMLASQEKRSYVTDRHMLIGLASLNPELLASTSSAGLTPAFVSETLRRNEMWTGPRAWIARHLRAVAMDETVLFLSEMLLTPRLVRLLQAANREAAESPVEPLHILRAILVDGNNRPCELLRREGRVPADILATLQALPAARPVAAAPPPAVEESRLVHPALSSGDLALDAKAREVAQTLENLAARYHLAAPEERYKVLRQALVDEAGRLSPIDRQKLFDQLRGLFPVLPGAAPDVAEVASLRRRLHELENRPDGTAGAGPVWPSCTVWTRLVVSTPDAPAEPGFQAARAVVEFALSVERFIAATAHNLTTRGNVTEAVALPGFRVSLQKLLLPALEGKEEALTELRTYLAAVERWLVATTAAYHESPGIWFAGFWSRLSPAAIEASVSEASRKKVFRIEAVELWNQFKELARGMTPELAADEILLVTGKRALEQYERLAEGGERP